MGSVPNKPSASSGAYPERPDVGTTFLDRTGVGVRLFCRKARVLRGQKTFVASVDAAGKSYRGRGDTAIHAGVLELRRQLATQGIRGDLVVDSFALIREIADRVIGQRPYDVQLLGGRAMLHGFVCEMETGEGKTLTATLPACTAALAGNQVHVVTVNDYLAQRDWETMGPIYEALGIRVGLVTHEQTPEERREAYACPVTYVTNKELVFDYLRDRMTLGDRDTHLHLLLEELGHEPRREDQLLLRGLDYAIVDELDSVLIDEACTPLILSRENDGDGNPYAHQWALGMAAVLRPREHYEVDFVRARIDLTEPGRSELRRLASEGSDIEDTWRYAREREERIVQALTAHHLYRRDRDYIVRDGKVEIVDRNTGRAMPDRAWEHGLHQAIEAKEGCVTGKGRHPMARMTYQRFFRRYLHLSGMTGTAREVSAELRSVYGLTHYPVPTHRLLRRREDSAQAFRTLKEKWTALVDRVEEVHATGQPILIGTRSVRTSELVAKLLEENGFSIRLLNARQDQEESEIVARAGERAAITVATDMAGRGTDIQLSDEVVELGGLHVISAEPHESRRVDRQLFGRCGRQGDPGSHERFLSLQDELLVQFAGKLIARVTSRWPEETTQIPAWIVESVCRHAQRVAERHRREMRRRLLERDDRTDVRLAFAGRESKPTSTRIELESKEAGTS